MEKILYIFLAIILLSLIVTVHEFGHYLVGRLCGIGIKEFSVGFGPKILGWKRKGIQYSLRCIPLGGYCAFEDEDEENPAPNAFSKSPVWKRFLTMISGPAMNFVLAFVACVILLSNFYYAEYQPRVEGIGIDTPAQTSGLQLGDIITEVNGEAISYDQAGANTVRDIIVRDGAYGPLDIIVQRGEEEIALQLTPELIILNEETGEAQLQIGISFGGRYYNFIEALRDSFSTMKEMITAMLNSLKNLFFKGEGMDEVMGTVGIVSVMSDMIRDERLFAAVNLTVSLSLNLGIINLLPLPALDGGRLVLLILEAIRRKPLPPEKEGMVHAAGFLLLIGIFLFFTYQDIVRLIAGG